MEETQVIFLLALLWLNFFTNFFIFYYCVFRIIASLRVINLRDENLS